jgi:hypothetical protein
VSRFVILLGQVTSSEWRDGLAGCYPATRSFPPGQAQGRLSNQTAQASKAS